MPIIGKLILILACLLFIPATGHTQDPGNHLPLSTPVMDLLRQEMNAIQQGMQRLIPAIASGNWQEVADIGEHIQHSYIMQQQLTDAQREELHQKLPPGFLELDQSFHHSAGMLAHAAQQQNLEVVNFYFYKLTDACVACHRRFAGNRFPGLAGVNGETTHPH